MRNAEWKFMHVRRLLTYVEGSIDRGSPWAVFEPNVRVEDLEAALEQFREIVGDLGRNMP